MFSEKCILDIDIHKRKMGRNKIVRSLTLSTYTNKLVNKLLEEACKQKGKKIGFSELIENLVLYTSLDRREVLRKKYAGLHKQKAVIEEEIGRVTEALNEEQRKIEEQKLISEGVI